MHFIHNVSLSKPESKWQTNSSLQREFKTEQHSGSDMLFPSSISYWELSLKGIKKKGSKNLKDLEENPSREAVRGPAPRFCFEILCSAHLISGGWISRILMPLASLKAASTYSLVTHLPSNMGSYQWRCFGAFFEVGSHHVDRATHKLLEIHLPPPPDVFK